MNGDVRKRSLPFFPTHISLGLRDKSVSALRVSTDEAMLEVAQTTNIVCENLNIAVLKDVLYWADFGG